jgi:transcriptional repressor NrdR
VRSSNENEIASEYIGGLVMEELADLDEITYVRFASVYRSFKDVSELESLLKQITKTAKKKKEQ